MKTTPAGQSTTSRSSKSALPWHLGFAVVIVGLSLGLGILLVAAKTESSNNFRMPPGQLQADTRTVFAAMRFLWDTEPDIELSPAALGDSVTRNLLGSTVQPHEMLACPSNQAELNCGTCTNPPVRG